MDSRLIGTQNEGLFNAFFIIKLSEKAYKKKQSLVNFCYDHAVAWDSPRTDPANIPHATVGSCQSPLSC
jgi:hypothetical protein